MRMTLTIYHPAFHPAYLLDLVRKGLETKRFSQMANEFPDFHFEPKSAEQPLEVEKIFRKIAFPLDLEPKFPDFLAKW